MSILEVVKAKLGIGTSPIPTNHAEREEFRATTRSRFIGAAATRAAELRREAAELEKDAADMVERVDRQVDALHERLRGILAADWYEQSADAAEKYFRTLAFPQAEVIRTKFAAFDADVRAILGEPMSTDVLAWTFADLHGGATLPTEGAFTATHAQKLGETIDKPAAFAERLREFAIAIEKHSKRTPRQANDAWAEECRNVDRLALTARELNRRREQHIQRAKQRDIERLQATYVPPAPLPAMARQQPVPQ
jgi:hypothetical protein